MKSSFVGATKLTFIFIVRWEYPAPAEKKKIIKRAAFQNLILSTTCSFKTAGLEGGKWPSLAVLLN